MARPVQPVRGTQGLQVALGVVPAPGGDHGVHQLEDHLCAHCRVAVAGGKDAVPGFERTPWLAGDGPYGQQDAIRLQGPRATRTKGQRFRGAERPLPQRLAGRLQPQVGGAQLVADLGSEAGRELAGLALKVRMQRLQRLHKARADSPPFYGEKRRSHRLRGQRVAEPEPCSVRVDELRPGCLAEPIDRLLRRAPGRRRHDVPVEVAPKHRRVAEETRRRLRQQSKAGIDGCRDGLRDDPL